MTKRVWMLRHAKSDWGDATLRDHERPLNKRGRRSAAAVAETFATENIRPDVVLVSTAVRAVQTAEPLGLTPTPTPALYNASEDDLLSSLRGLPDELTSALVIGHNPGMEDLAGRLGDGRGMSTATLLGFDVDAETWAEVGRAASVLIGRWEHSGHE